MTVTFDELIRYRNRLNNRNRFNIIGFTNYSNWRPTKTCGIHRGNVLIRRRNLETGEEMRGLMCPVCGTYTESEVPTDENTTGEFSGKTETNNEYKQGEDTFYDNKTSRIIRTRKK